MQRIGGLLLILAGVTLGASTFLPPPFDAEQALREVTRISAAPDRSTHDGLPHASAGGLYAGQNLALAAMPANRLETGEVNRPSAAWSAIVTAAPAQGRITSSKPGDSQTRVQLTRDLQAELKRVGCYGGTINGAWTPSTRRAMSAFMERVNATLPIGEPDYILLSLVHGHAGQACGIACPSGQTASPSGRCLPKAVIAARTGKHRNEPAAIEPPTGGYQVAARQPNPSIRRAGAAAVAARAAPARVREARLAAPPQNAERLPWQKNDDVSAPLRRVASRPDGMMAVGAPRGGVDAGAGGAPASVTITPAPGRTRIVTTKEDIDPRAERSAPVLDAADPATAGDGFEAGQTAKSVEGPFKRKHTKSAKTTNSAPASAKKAKPAKFFFYAGDSTRRRGLTRPGSPAWHMQQAMGGIF